MVKTRSRHALTAGTSARRVEVVTAELSADDKRIVVSPDSRSARRRAAPFVLMALPQLAALRGKVPSYVMNAIDDLSAAFARWESDERNAL